MQSSKPVTTSMETGSKLVKSNDRYKTRRSRNVTISCRTTSLPVNQNTSIHCLHSWECCKIFIETVPTTLDCSQKNHETFERDSGLWSCAWKRFNYLKIFWCRLGWRLEWPKINFRLCIHDEWSYYKLEQQETIMRGFIYRRGWIALSKASQESIWLQRLLTDGSKSIKCNDHQRR